jgi:hypothetical protein
MKYWEIIADNLSKAGWSWGCVSAVDRDGRTIFVADAHRDDGKRFIVRARDVMRVKTHNALKSPACSCVSIPVASGTVNANHRIM